MQASHSPIFFAAATRFLTLALSCSAAFAQAGGAPARPGSTQQTGTGTETGTGTGTQSPGQVRAPLDNAPPSVVAVAWSGFGEAVPAAEHFALPGPHNPAALFQQTMLHMLQGSSGVVYAPAWQGGTDAPGKAAPATGGETPEDFAELWRQRLTAHRAVAGLALTPTKTGSAAGTGSAAESAATPTTIAEITVLLNSIRQQVPDAMDTGPEARVLRALNFINARSIYVAAVLPATPVRTPATPETAKGAAETHTLAGVPMMRLAISWSSRSEPPERCRAVVIGETTVTATDWPADVPPGPWVLAIRPNAYYGSLGSGMGNYLRYAVAIETASRPGNGRGPESPATSISAPANDLCGAIARAADRTFFVCPINGVPTLLLPCRGADEATAALAAAAKLLGVKPDETTETPWGSVKLMRLGSRSIALRLLAAK